ncbi:MAG: response regulator, partial [Ignavibacteria bacterium]|nr:response regulator [Ignavibacteria bacterium]
MENNHTKPHILVIDDEIALCIAVKDLLESYAYSVYYAITAEEGIAYLEKNETDAVLLDINLGSGLNGVEALAVIKEKFNYTQVIMFTSMTTIETGIECMKKGALD